MSTARGTLLALRLIVHWYNHFIPNRNYWNFGIAIMSHILITFLGSRKNGSANRDYQTARYEFPDGNVRETSYFGLSLAEYLQPDKMVILGTYNSQWRVLVENLAEGDEMEDERLALLESEDSGEVNQEILTKIAPVMEKSVGIPVIPRLIPYGKDTQEQFEILSIINETIPGSDTIVSFDLTHGFRHLAMIGFLSAFMLEKLKNVTVKDLWYGALDMTIDGITPVIELDGLVQVRKWIEALDHFESSGDYGGVARLLEVDEVPSEKTRLLEKAAYYESITNIFDAKRSLKDFLPLLNEPLPGATGLFQNRLKKRLQWVTQKSITGHQQELAKLFLQRNDFVRAAIFGWESIITQHSGETDAYLNVSERNDVASCLYDRMYNLPDGNGEREAFYNLKDIRNILAHGGEPTSKKIERILKNRQKLHDTLSDAFDVLFQN